MGGREWVRVCGSDAMILKPPAAVGGGKGKGQGGGWEEWKKKGTGKGESDKIREMRGMVKVRKPLGKKPLPKPRPTTVAKQAEEKKRDEEMKK